MLNNEVEGNGRMTCSGTSGFVYDGEWRRSKVFIFLRIDLLLKEMFSHILLSALLLAARSRAFVVTKWGRV